MKYLILFLISLNCFAKNYIPKSKIGMDSSYTIYLEKSECEKISSEQCFEIATGEDNSIKKVDQIEVDGKLDYNTKNQIYDCSVSGKGACDFAHANLFCQDQEETPIKNYDLMEVYCSKPVYEKEIIEIPVPDLVKVSARDAMIAAKEADETDLGNKKTQIKSVLSKLQGGGDMTAAERRQFDIYLIKKLLQ